MAMNSIADFRLYIAPEIMQHMAISMSPIVASNGAVVHRYMLHSDIDFIVRRRYSLASLRDSHAKHGGARGYYDVIEIPEGASADVHPYKAAGREAWS